MNLVPGQSNATSGITVALTIEEARALWLSTAYGPDDHDAHSRAGEKLYEALKKAGALDA